MKSSLVNDNELLYRMAGRDEDAFRIVYDRYSERIYKYALHLLKSEELAEDNVQETFFKLWKLGNELATVRNLESYLVTISRNRSLDTLRKMKLTAGAERSVQKNWVEGHNDTEEFIILDDTRKVLQQAIDLLPPQQKIVYQLCHNEGLKYDEAAKKLDISANTVKLYMKLSLRFLRSYLSKHTDLKILLVIFMLF